MDALSFEQLHTKLIGAVKAKDIDGVHKAVEEAKSISTRYMYHIHI